VRTQLVVLLVAILPAACDSKSATPTQAATPTPTPRAFRPFELSVHTQSSVSASAYGGETGRDRHPTQARTRSTGGEPLGECHGRHSGADAAAQSETQDRRDWSAALLLSAEARANGGHYLEGACFLRQGHDTTAESEARAEGTLQVRFLDDAGEAPYEIRLKRVWVGEPSESAVFSARLVNSQGKAVAEGPQWQATVPGVANAAYTIAISLSTRASDTGACCSSSKRGSLRAEVEVIRSPGLAQGLEAMQRVPPAAAIEVKPFIFGGELVEEGYEAVGALMFEKEVECSGALVGAKTVLTAAHCVFDRPRELYTRMSFRLGNNAYVPVAALGVRDVLYPTPANASAGLAYVHSRRLPQNDIALVYLDRPAPNVTPFALHEGQPALELVKQEQTRLDFVGFGFNLVERSKAGIGRKRHVLMPIETLEKRWIRYGDGNAGTCEGDSGGPAFLLIEKKGVPPRQVLAGVTSAGPLGCRGLAYDTRVDEFAAWLKTPGRIQ
jgi:hypothetical protein